LYADKSVKVQVGQGEMISVKTGWGRQGCVCHQFCSMSTASALPRKLLKGLETSK
jgi:hypothetical protein